MRRAATVLKHFAFYSLIAAAVVKLLAVAAAYVAISHRAEIQYWLSNKFGVPVTIEHLNIHWNSYIPRLAISGLSMGENNALELGNAQIGVHLPALVFRRHVIPINISLRGTHINILRDADGVTRVLGLSNPDSDTPPVTSLVLPAFVRIHDATLTWKDRKRNANITLPSIDLELINLGQEYLLEADLHTSSGEVKMRARASGNLLTSNWSAQTYISSSSFNASEMFEAYLPDHYQVENLVVDLNSWSNWVQGRHSNTRADFQVGPFSLGSKNRGSVPIDSLRGSINHRVEADGWQLQMADLSLTMWQRSWPEAKILLNYRQKDNEASTYKLAADFLRLQDVVEIASLEPGSGELMAQLQSIGPEADIKDLQFSYTTSHGANDWQLATEFNQLSSRPWGKIPGIANFSGAIRANPSHVQLQLHTVDAALDLQNLFRTPLPLTELSGQIDWLKQADSWQIFSNSLVAENADIKTRSRFNLTGNPLFMDLQTNFHDGLAANAGTYYPTGIMPPGLVKWLDEAIVDGQITRGAALLHGPLKKFPFHKSHDGHFEVLFEAEDVTLNYRQDWPVVDQVIATTRFHNNQMDINASHGRIFDSKARQAAIHIPRLNPASQVELQLDTSGPVTDIFRFLKESPLKEQYRSRIEAMTGDGKTRFEFDLRIPLDHSDRYAFNGDLTLQDATLQLKDWDISLSNINGQLKMDSSEYRPSTLTATTLNTPVTVNILPTSRPSTLIQTNGNFPVGEVIKMAPALPPLGLHGTADFLVEVDLPTVTDNGAETLLRVSSNLEGIGIDLPQPLGKSATDNRALHFEMPIRESATAMQINYEQAFDLSLLQTETGNFDLNGTLYALPVSQWTAFINSLEIDLETTAPPVTSLDLVIKHTTLGPVEAIDLGLVANYTDTGWFGYLSSETVSGSFRIPQSGIENPLMVELDHLRIEYEPEQPEVSADALDAPDALDALDYVDPRSIPALKLTSKAFTFNEAELGSAVLSAYPIKEGLIFDKLEVDGDLVSLQGEGRWLLESDEPQSQANIVAEIPDLGALLNKMRFTSQVEEAKADISLRASWPGGPTEFEMARLAGLLDIEIGEGRLLEIDPGAGRMLGLLNLRALQRRLSLDFSDIYQYGLVIDRMAGNFLIEEGNAYTNNLEIIGPTGRINISGRTGLADKDYDQLVSVTPRVGATLPLAGAVVGGPVTGLAVLVAQTVITKAVPATGKLAKVQYSITGPWDDPEITRLKRKTDADQKTTVDEQETGD